MGVTLGPVFDKKFPEASLFSDFSDGKDLLNAMPRFDEICVAKGVTLFSTLAGPDEEELLALAAKLEEGEALEDIWFSCADGIHTVSTIIRALESEKQWSKGLRPYQIRDLIIILRRLEETLSIGKKKKARFYFLCC